VNSRMSCSGRSACRWLGFNRSSLRYEPKPLPPKRRLLEAQIVKVSREHPTLGYKKVTGLMRSKGDLVNKKQVQRVRREEGLQVPPPKPRERRQGLSTGLPQQATHRNHVWCWDFVADFTQRGGKLRVFNLIDEFTRECHCIHADRSIKAADVLRLLQEAIEENGPPEFVRSDNGPEFIARAIQNWLAQNKIKTIYIDPGCPWQNGYAESFNSRFRIECLDRELLYTLSESRVVFADWRAYYNNVRPHRSLGLQSPTDFARNQSTQGLGSGRPAGSLRPGIQQKQHQTTETVS
jgi:putative transposase